MFPECKILISIIVPVYKVEKYIGNCIQSVQKQTYHNWELILVNDGSPDNSAKICDYYAEKDNRVKVFHKSNGGVASARNLGLDNMSGEYVTFLDSDDFLHPEFLDNLLKLAISNNADIVQCGYIRGIDKEFPIIHSKEIINEVNNYDVFLKGFAKVIVWGKLYKKNILKGLPIPENKLFEDDFITWRWYFKAKKTIVTNKQLYYYTDNNDSAMAGYVKNPRLDFMEAYFERISYFKEIKEREMEEYSRIHFCKSLLLTYTNPMLSCAQKDYVYSNFNKNWLKIKDSKVIKLKLKVLFKMFEIFPNLVSKILKIAK